MKNRFKKEYLLLLIIFLFIVAFRLYFVFQTEQFSDDDAYFHLRYAKQISEKGYYSSFDELSYSGRNIVILPFYPYLLGFFGMIFNLELVAKVLPEILISLFVVIAYLIAKEISNDNKVALLVAFMAGIFPYILSKTLNNASIISIVLLMFFFLVYCLMRMREERKYLMPFVIVAILLAATHQAAFLLIVALMIYSLILTGENWRVRRVEREAVIFYILIVFLVEFFVFKNAFLEYGLSVIWQNIPEQILNEYFVDISFTYLFYALGIVPILFGITAIFYGAFREKKNNLYLLNALILSILLLLILKLVNVVEGLIFLGATLTILSSLVFSKLFSYIKITKVSRYYRQIVGSIITIIVLSLVIPAYYAAGSRIKEAPDEIDVRALEWLRDNVKDGSVILANLDEGNLLIYTTGKKNVIDDNFLLAPNVDDRLKAVEVIYGSGSEYKALELLRKYKVDYIFLSEKSKNKYKIDDLKYSEDEKCFRRRKYEEPKIYEVREC